MPKLTLEEQETIIRYDNKNQLADIYTWNKTLIKKLIIIAKSRPEITILESDENYMRCTVPKKWIKVNAPRQMSEAERRKRAERLKQIKKPK